MADRSHIQWTDATWNPTTGCTKVSPGCANCYIERTPAFRINHRPFVNGATDLRLHYDRLDQPLRWRKPRRIFVNSLSDLFHDDVPDAFIERVFDVMALTPRHTYQVLTKRAERMRTLVPLLAAKHTAADGSGWPLPNVWLGVSVENQHFADARIPLLLQTPAAIRFVSYEPALGPVDFRPWLRANVAEREHGSHGAVVVRERPGLDWIIAGGESGPGARPCDRRWFYALLDQVQATMGGTRLFIKQLGAKSHIDGTQHLLKLKDKKGGDLAEFPPDLRVREYPA